MPPTSFPLNQFLHSQLWFSTFSQTGLENWANDNLMIPNSAKTLSSHDNQCFSADGKATRKKVKLCYRKWLSYVIVTMIWNICPGVSWSVAYRYSVGLSTHSRIRVRGSRNCRRYCTVQLQYRLGVMCVSQVGNFTLRIVSDVLCNAVIKWRISATIRVTPSARHSGGRCILE